MAEVTIYPEFDAQVVRTGYGMSWTDARTGDGTAYSTTTHNIKFNRSFRNGKFR